MNLSIIFIIIGFVLFIVSLLLVQQKKEFKRFKNEDDRERYTYDALMSFIKHRMNDITTKNLYNENLTEEEFKRRNRRRQELKDALKNCNTGDISSKIYVREYIFDLLNNEYGMDEQKVNFTIPFDSPQNMTAREKFETLLCLAGKKHGGRAFGVLIEWY